MSILIYLALLLTSGSICHGLLSEDTYIYKSDYPIRISIHNETPVLKETELINLNQGSWAIRNPNDSKYQKIAKDFVHSQLRIREEDIINITLYKVTTTADSAQITKLQFRVFLVDAQSIGCRAKIWEQPWQHVETASYCCETHQNNKMSSDHNGNLRPDNPKYHVLVRQSLKAWFKIDGQVPFKEEDIKAIDVTSVKTQITYQVINVINFNVITRSNEHFICIGRIMDMPWDPEDTLPFPEIKCNIDGDVTDSREWTEILKEIAHTREVRDHNDIKYKQLATEAAGTYFVSTGNKIFKIDEIKMKSVIGMTTRTRRAEIIYINFDIAAANTGTKTGIFNCSSVYEKLEHTMKSLGLHCLEYSHQYGASYWENPADSRFEVAAKKSLKKYREKSGGHLGGTDIIVTFVVKRLVEEIMYDINFIVHPNQSHKLECYSSVWDRNNLEVKAVGCENVNGVLHSSEVQQNPDEPKYLYLAEASLENYKKSHVDLFFEVREVKVTRVTTQVDFGEITRIDFFVISTGGNSFPCHSEIREQQSLQKKDITVTCDYDKHQKPGGQEQKNPNEPKYKYLAEEAFEKYRKSHIDLLIEVRELKVTRVTTQVVLGEITRIDFFVIPTNGKSFLCHSEIREQQPLEKKDIIVTCDDEKLQQPEDQVQQNPNDPIYKYLAEEAFEKYRKSRIDLLIEVREVKVTRVTTQVVSRKRTRIDFLVTSIKGETFSCLSEIWEHQVIQKKDISVTCDYDKHQQAGGQVQQNPDEPKYKDLAEESFEKYRKSHIGLLIDGRELRVTRVTTQVFSGVITRIDFSVIPVAGESFPCYSEIWEHQSLHSKNITVICDYDKYKLLPEGQVQVNPSELKYKYLAEESFEKYRKLHIGVLFEIRELKVTRVTTQVVVGEITRIDFIVIPTDGNSFPCHSEIREQQSLQKKDITVTCDYDKHQEHSGQVLQNPDEPKYKYLAEEAFEKYRKSHIGILIEVRELRVSRVTTQLVSGVITRIDFSVIPKMGESIPCHSEIWENQSLQYKDITVTCNYNKHQQPGGQVQENADDLKYKYLAEEAFEKYRKSHIGLSIKVREIKVTQVTTQVVAGEITRIDFFVIPTDGKSFPCHSEIRENQPLQSKAIIVNCDYDEHQEPSGQAQQNPDDPKHKYLAEESFEKYRKSHSGILIGVQELKVTRVTTQVVSGVITRIDFSVIPIAGESFPCHSEIWEHQSVQYKDITVTCDYYKIDKHQQSGGQVQQNPDDPKYRHLAEESFEKYRNSHFGIVSDVKELRVTKVTTQEVLGLITRIGFLVTPIKGEPFACHSEIWEFQTLKNKDITVTCNYDIYQLLPNGQVQQNPDDPKYKYLAVESFEKYRKSHIGLLFEVRELKITRVTTQVISGIITRIDFNVNPIKGESFPCHSEIRQQPSLQKKDITVTCDYYEYKLLPDDQVQQNPDNIIYKQLAEESFQKYLKYHTDIRIQVKSLKVTKVTTQLHGPLIRIDFHVYPTKGRTIPCHSEIRKPLHESDFTVNCQLNEHANSGDQEEQDPDNQKYKDLTKQSFEKYLAETGLLIKVNEIKITRVIRQEIWGKITTRIEFNVIPAEGMSFPCRSEIQEEQLLHEKEIIVSCSHEKYQLLPGGQVQQTSDNPEYKLLAEESFEKFLKSHTNIRIQVKDLKLAKITIQVESRTVILIDFHVYPTKGHAIPCHSEIWKQDHKKNITVHCQLNQTLKPGPQEVQDPNDPKYKHLTKESFETYLSQIGIYIEVHELRVIQVTSEVFSGVMTTRIDFNVILAKGETFPCHSEIREQQLLYEREIVVTCSHEKYQLLSGGPVQQNPDNPEYKLLAEESFEIFLKSHTNIRIKMKDVKVAKVTIQVVSGTVIRIDFHVYPTKGHTIPCHSEIWKQNHKKNITVHCQLNQHLKPGSLEVQDPNNPKYKHLTEESFETYRSQIGLYIEVHEFRVIRVTSQVVSGVTTTRIDFKVILAEGETFPCHSEIREEQSLHEKEIIVSCSHKKYKLSTSGPVQQNSDSPEYKLLAEESFKKFLKSHSIRIQIKDLKVTRVTTQIVSGTVIRIHFQVYPAKGRMIPCESEIRKQLHRSDFNVQCKLNLHNNTSGQEEQDPDDPKYKYLAEESFEMYMSRNGILIDVEQLKVTRVTTEVVSGVITRIDFNVIPIIGKSFPCQSQIWEHVPQKKEITVKCETHTKHTDLTLSLSQHDKTNEKRKLDPDNPKYKHLAQESFEVFQKYNSGPLIRVQKLIVTRVTTQIVSVSEIKTCIDFKVTTTKNKLFNCHSEVHEKKTLQKKDKQFKVKCDERQTRKKLYVHHFPSHRR